MILLLPCMLLAMTASLPLANHHDGTRVKGWSFSAERVCLVVSETDFTVDAEYEFHSCDTADELVIRYPFPADSSLGQPELLAAGIRALDGREVPLQVMLRDDAWRWVLDPTSGRTIRVHIAYRQAIAARRATYVLTSTRDWNHPLSKAVFEIRTPARTRAAVSLPALQTEEGDARVYRAEFLNWTPTGDLVVRLE